jgi:hypothetical protein
MSIGFLSSYANYGAEVKDLDKKVYAKVVLEPVDPPGGAEYEFYMKEWGFRINDAFPNLGTRSAPELPSGDQLLNFVSQVVPALPSQSPWKAGTEVILQLWQEQ